MAGVVSEGASGIRVGGPGDGRLCKVLFWVLFLVQWEIIGGLKKICNSILCTFKKIMIFVE